jgi:tetratricopeptide (TPR) repeat protein
MIALYKNTRRKRILRNLVTEQTRMSNNARGSDIVHEIRRLLITHGFNEHQVDLILDKLRIELLQTPKEDCTDVTRITTCQRLAHFITTIQLGEHASPVIFKAHYDENYLIIIGLLPIIIFESLRELLGLIRSKDVEDSAESFLNRGIANIQQGEYDRAIENFDRAIELKPDFPDAFNSRSYAYLHKGEYDRAIEDCNRAIELKPDFPDAFNNPVLCSKRHHNQIAAGQVPIVPYPDGRHLSHFRLGCAAS